MRNYGYSSLAFFCGNQLIFYFVQMKALIHILSLHCNCASKYICKNVNSHLQGVKYEGKM